MVPSNDWLGCVHKKLISKPVHSETIKIIYEQFNGTLFYDRISKDNIDLDKASSIIIEK
jgi:hypothetical protein